MCRKQHHNSGPVHSLLSHIHWIRMSFEAKPCAIYTQNLLQPKLYLLCICTCSKWRKNSCSCYLKAVPWPKFFSCIDSRKVLFGWNNGFRATLYLSDCKIVLFLSWTLRNIFLYDLCHKCNSWDLTQISKRENIWIIMSNYS